MGERYNTQNVNLTDVLSLFFCDHTTLESETASNSDHSQTKRMRKSKKSDPCILTSCMSSYVLGTASCNNFCITGSYTFKISKILNIMNAKQQIEPQTMAFLHSEGAQACVIHKDSSGASLCVK